MAIRKGDSQSQQRIDGKGKFHQKYAGTNNKESTKIINQKTGKGKQGNEHRNIKWPSEIVRAKTYRKMACIENTNRQFYQMLG